VPLNLTDGGTDNVKQTSMYQDRYHDINGVILVGGKSLRMGRDKAFLNIAGKTFFEQVLEILGKTFDRLMLVSNQTERFAGYGLPVLPDIYPGRNIKLELCQILERGQNAKNNSYSQRC
jgi:molybdopterin-guanine dinucleotide biosynthesis protein A